MQRLIKLQDFISLLNMLMFLKHDGIKRPGIRTYPIMFKTPKILDFR